MKMLVSVSSLWTTLFASILFLGPQSTTAAPREDLITNLPLFGPPPTPQYSGYLNATDGCDTDRNGEYCRIHYWFAQAETLCCCDKPASEKPVILWLNGGPGSSSILGFLQELGPLLINATGGLMQNPWSWTKVANVFVIEAPVGVGYSYCANQADGKLCKNTDRYTASASRAALVDFFTNKFPELADNDFYITGESYAGVYIPTLAKELLDHAPQINLKGLAVGDPCTDNTAQRDTMDPVWYSHKYGLIDDALFHKLWHECQARFANPLHAEAKNIDEWQTQVLQSSTNIIQSDDCKLARRKFMLSTSKALSQSWKDLFVDDYSLFSPVSSLEDEQMADYMNRPDVKEALHVLDTPIDTWPYPVQGFHYRKEYDACNEHPIDGATSMIDFYSYIAPKLEGSVWVYNGDTDPCVTYEGTRKAIRWVGFPEVEGGSYRPWFYNHSATTIDVLVEKSALFGPDLLVQNMGAQFAGEVVNYEHGLAFLTIHGSGHMVPQFRPQAALHMISKLLSGDDLSPPYPSDSQLLNMTGQEFMAALNDWTEMAKAHPYVTGKSHAAVLDEKACKCEDESPCGIHGENVVAMAK